MLDFEIRRSDDRPGKQERRLSQRLPARCVNDRTIGRIAIDETTLEIGADCGASCDCSRDVP